MNSLLLDFSYDAYGSLDYFLMEIKDRYVLRIWVKDEKGDTHQIYKRLVGYTILSDGDALLHLIAIDPASEEHYDVHNILNIIEKQGVEFVTFSAITKYGFEIKPEDQEYNKE